VLCDHVIELEPLERLNEGALVLAQDQFGHELRNTLVLDVLEDIDLFIELLDSSLVAVVLEQTILPPN